MDGLEGAVLEVEQSVDAGGEVEQQQPQQTQQDAQRQADKEYKEWLKSRREDGEDGKYYKRIKGDHERLESLRRIDPKGIDGVRSRYDALNGIAHGDKTGMDAVQSIQEALAESQTVLDAIAQGDISSLGDEQRDGVMRMAPSMLDHLADSNPEAYAALLTPHFWQAIEASPLARYYSGMVDVLNEKPPAWLTKEQVPQWTLEHVGRITEMARGMGQWFTDLQKKSEGAADTKTQVGGKPEAQASQPNQQFWKTSVYPQTNAHAEEAFNRELRPWAEKLAKSGIRLSDAKKQALAQEMVSSVSALAQKNQSYAAQMKRFNSQRSPDAASVISTFKSEFNRHAKSVVENLIRRDYGQILDKGTKAVTKTATSGNGTKAAPVQPGVKIVSVKPSRDMVDYQRTPLEWIHMDKYRMKDGSVVQYRP